MQLQFNSRELSWLERICNRVIAQEQTAQVYTDTNIEKVIGAWGQGIVRGKQWQNNLAEVIGGVMAWVMYQDKDGKYCTVHSWIPMTWKVDLPPTEKDGTLLAGISLVTLDARELGENKLLLRADAQLQVSVFEEKTANLYDAEDVPEDVQLQKKTHRFMIPTEAGEKAFEIEDRQEMPSGATPVNQILYYRLYPLAMDQKVMADKLVFRGSGNLVVVYKGVDGEIHSAQIAVPFAQFANLAGQYPEEAWAQLVLAVTNLDVSLETDGRLLINLGLTGQYLVCKPEEITVVADAYSTQRDVTLQKETLHLQCIKSHSQDTVSFATGIPEKPERVIDCVFMAQQPSMQYSDEEVQIQGTFSLLCKTEGDLQAVFAHCAQALDTDNGWLVLTGTPGSVSEAAGLAVSVDGTLDAIDYSAEELTLLTGLQLAKREDVEERPSLILRRVGSESLWDMAKATGSTIEAIMKANQLTQEPESNQMLIIPLG